MNTLNSTVGVFPLIDYKNNKNDEFLDPVTNLPNRAMLMATIEKVVERVDRRSSMALLSLSLDSFKSINDNLGKDSGHELLIQVSQRIKTILRKSDLLTRLDEGEFMIVLENIKDAEVPSIIARKILETLRDSFTLKSQELLVSTSIGICLAVKGFKTSAKELLKQADLALYLAKKEGSNNYQHYAPNLDTSSQRRLQISNELHRALCLDEFEIFYQAQADLKTGKIVGFEALLRWDHPSKGMLSPQDFIPILEENNLIQPIGRWALHTSLTQLKLWIDSGLVSSDCNISINFSPKQFNDTKFLSGLLSSVRAIGLSPNNITLEITETALLQSDDSVKDILNDLSSKGFFLSLDDFGTGYSSLSHLKSYPIDEIKIDRSFIKNLLTEPNDLAITKALVAMCNSLDLHVVAEGVENSKTLAKLKELGEMTYQGYILNRPQSAQDIEMLFFDNNQNKVCHLVK